MSKKILVVDDEPDLVHLFQLVLEMSGYQVCIAHGGVQALKIYQREKPHLVLLDVMMPDMNGLEVCRNIRSTEDGEEPTKIIMYTANDSIENRRASREVGADDLLSKDVSVDSVTAAISSYFEPATA